MGGGYEEGNKARFNSKLLDDLTSQENLLEYIDELKNGIKRLHNGQLYKESPEYKKYKEAK